MWACARKRLGLSREEFFRLQPRQLDAMIRQERYETEHREFLFAQLTKVVMDYSLNPPKQQKKIADFMPSRMKPKAAPRYQSRERVAANVEQIFAGFIAKG